MDPASRTVELDHEPLRRSPLAIVAAAGALVLFAVLVWLLRAFVTDDAFISLRYARNLAEGHGPVWNPGGPPVEGYSNPLFVFAEAVVFRLGLDAVAAVRLGGVLSGLGLVAVCFWMGRRVLGDRAAGSAAVLVAASPALAYWAVGGLETLPMALVVTAATLELARPDGGSPVRAGILLALLPWIRPEGLAVAGAIVFCSEVGGLFDQQRRPRTIRRLLWLALLPLASQIGLQALRLAWFGHHLPNSVIYKAGTGQLGRVTLKFLREIAPMIVPAAVGLVLLPGRLRLIAVPAVVYLAASLTFLDSVNTYSRLLLPTYPLWALLAATALSRYRTADRDRRGWLAAVTGTAVLAGLMLVVVVPTVPQAKANGERYAGCKHVARRDGGHWLNERLEPGQTYAVGDAGVLPFYAGGPALDLFGLNEPVLQETGSQTATEQAERVLSAAPDFLVLASEERDELRPVYRPERLIRRDPRFEAYQPATVTGSPGCQYYFHIYQRSG